MKIVREETIRWQYIKGITRYCENCKRFYTGSKSSYRRRKKYPDHSLTIIHPIVEEEKLLA